jgi:hypothetical protein
MIELPEVEFLLNYLTIFSPRDAEAQNGLRLPRRLRKNKKVGHSERSEESLFDLSAGKNNERFFASLGMTRLTRFYFAPGT